MNGLFIGLGILVILTMCWMGYVRKVERRSFSSHLIERLLFLFVKPLTYS